MIANSSGVDEKARSDGLVPLARRASFHSVGILHHPMKPESLALAEEIAHFLRDEGVADVWRESAWDVEPVMTHIAESDLLVTLGGDGTMLRAARMGASYSVPMLGVKMGRLGFLAEVQPEDWQGPLRQMLRGDYWIEERLMITARVERAGEDGAWQAAHSFEALNDVVVSRGDLARVVRIAAELDGGYLTKYTCDGLIVSTSTGATGYALAVGGPILPPELRNMLLIPIAPHLSMDRAVVLSEGTEVRLKTYADHRPILTVDGQVVVEMESGDEVVVKSSPHVAQFIRMRDKSYFYRGLVEKMYLRVE